MARVKFPLLILLAFLSAGMSGPGREAVHQDDYGRLRKMLVREIQDQGVMDERVLSAIGNVPREQFVPDSLKPLAYADLPLPIGQGQTISQPAVVGLMTQLLEVHPGRKILEIGTGSGYQAAVLAEAGAEVYSVEIIPELAAQAEDRLRRLGYDQVHVRTGDGYKGWPEQAPFDAILLTAAPPQVPPALFDQLGPGGRLVAPVGENDQELVLFIKTPSGIVQERLIPVRFVPMVRGKEAQTHEMPTL